MTPLQIESVPTATLIPHARTRSEEGVGRSAMSRECSQAALTPMRAIRAKCLDCSGGSTKEVRLCPVTTCALWPYRMGRRPRASKKSGTYVPDFCATRDSEGESAERLRSDELESARGAR